MHFSLNFWWRATAVGLGLTLVSCLLMGLAVEWGRQTVPQGPGYPHAEDVQSDLFRFDSTYYLDIAKNGYSYNGDPGSSPNIVFAPLFPMLVSAVSTLFDAEPVEVGFALNHLFLWIALTLLYVCWREWFGQTKAWLTLLALVTAAGSYSLHAFYSESLMLLFLALSLLSVQRRWWFALALSCVGLGATRVATLPLLLVYAGVLVYQAYLQRAHLWKAVRLLGDAVLCGGGIAAYLIYIGVQFGEPFALLREVQRVSWGLFHPPAAIFPLVTGIYLLEYWHSALTEGMAVFTDIKALNLVWTTLALVACVHSWRKRPHHITTLLFTGYFLFIYWSGAASEYLISTHRFFLFMLPIYLMFADGYDRIALRSRSVATALLVACLLLNAGYGVFHAAKFNQGVWYFF